MKPLHTIAFVSALCLTCSGMPAAAFADTAAIYAEAAETTSEDCFIYEKKDNTIRITGITEDAPAEIVIPAEIEGLPVTEIAKEAFWKRYTVTSVVVPEGVITIEPYAFAQNGKLKSVVLPETLTSADLIFYQCTGLESVNIPKSLGGVPRGMFSGCTSLKSVVIPDGAVSIGYGAFQGCTALEEITIPETVSEYDSYPFDKTPWLDAKRAENPLVIINNQLIDACTAEGAVVIPEGVTGIIASALYNNRYVTELTIPASVKLIGAHALEGCSGLTALMLPDGLEVIGENAFNGLSMIKEVVIPDTVQSLGEGAFYGWSSLESVTVPGSVGKIPHGAFAGCMALKSITLEEGITTIEESAFNGCGSLAEINIPKTTVNFGGMVFQTTPWLAAKRAENPLVTINGVLVDGITCSGDLVIPECVVKIGDSAFFENKALTSVTIPEGVTAIEMRAFSQCEALKSAKLPQSLKSIGIDAFSHCKALYSAVLPDTVSEIGASAFMNCRSLYSVRIPGALDTIANSLFYGCDALTRVTIPDNIKAIENSAFNSCSNLEAVYIDNPECAIEDAASTISNSNDAYSGKIYGYKNSTAEQYAEKYERQFVSIGEPGHLVPTTWGDVNLDDSIDVSDVVLICRFAAEDQNVRILAQGRLNGDVNGSGGLDKADAAKILRYIARYLTKEQLAPES